MRNKKNIKRKKKLNTPKPSVLAVFSEARGGLSVISPSLCNWSVFFYLLSSSRQADTFPSDELQPFTSTAVGHGAQAGVHAETAAYPEIEWRPDHT